MSQVVLFKTFSWYLHEPLPFTQQNVGFRRLYRCSVLRTWNSRVNHTFFTRFKLNNNLVKITQAPKVLAMYSLGEVCFCMKTTS